MICDERFQGRFQPVWNRPHFKALHQDFLTVYKKWARNLLLSAVVGIAILVPSDYFELVSQNLYFLALVNAAFVFLMQAWILQFLRIKNKFRRIWREEHSDGKP